MAEITKFHTPKLVPTRINQRNEWVRETGTQMKAGAFDAHVFLARNRLNRRVLQYQANQRIFSQGDLCDAVFYIEKGKVKLVVTSRQGKEAIVAMLGPGDFIAEIYLTDQKVHLASAIAMAPSTILKIQKRQLLSALEKDHTLANHFIMYLLSRNRRIEEDLIDQYFSTGEKRLARALLLLANYARESKPAEMVLNINQDTLAKIIGVTRERVNFLMNKFRKLGFISYNDGLQVYDSLINIILRD